MATPLFDAVKKYASAHTVRLHTPGHSAKSGVLSPFAPVLPLDVTELPGLDSLYEADGPILQSEQQAASLFGAGRTLISAGGCTLAIQTMLALCGAKKVAMGRGAHKSAVNACALLDIQPLWLYPNASGVISPDAVEAVLDGSVGAVYLTSPNYYGQLCDVAAIAEVCRKKDVLLLVDNAHGSHLAFGKRNLHPLALGADFTADSAHKTLPVLTGGAWLHIKNAAHAVGAKDAMALFGSTSPSYLTMCSLDLAADWLLRQGRAAFERLEEEVSQLKQMALELNILPDFTLCDPMRLTLHTAKVGVRGADAAAYLAEQGITAEYADEGYAVLIFTPFHTGADLQKVAKALPGVLGLTKTNLGQAAFACTPKATVLTPRQAALSAKATVSVAQALGQIAASAVCICPPGVPILLPGERIDAQAVEQMQQNGITQLQVVKQ